MSVSSSATATGSATDRVYAHVKEAILEQVYEGGSLLTEGEIAEAVGCSRTPVREALLRLAAEDLVRLYPKKGALVLPMSARDVDDVLEARELVEGFAAARAWRHRERLVAELAPLLEQMREHAAADDPRALMAADRTFHEHIVEAAGNSVLTRFYLGLRDRQRLMGVAVMRISPERMHRAVHEHAQLLDVLRSGDEDDFRRLVHDHVTTAGDQLRTLR